MARRRPQLMNGMLVRHFMERHPEMEHLAEVLDWLFDPVPRGNRVDAKIGDPVYYNESGVWRAVATDMTTCASGVIFDVIGNTVWLHRTGQQLLQKEDNAVRIPRGTALWLSATNPGTVTSTVPSGGIVQQQIGICKVDRYAEGLVHCSLFVVAPTQTFYDGSP